MEPESYERVMGLAKAIEALPADDNDAVLELVSASGITYGDFRFMDEKPGSSCFTSAVGASYRSANWHRRLRIVRNDPTSDLFDRFAR